MDGTYFRLRGVIEGFYGTYYTFPERNDLIRFLGQHDFNFYLYGPKNDRQHRMRWWDPYPPAVLDDFARTIRIAEESGVSFCYAISFGVPLNYASPEDFETITAKLRTFYDRGSRSFGVLLDDITDGFVHEGNRTRFRNIAEAHADCCNRLLDWARSLDESCRLYLCQSEYCGRPPFGEYLADLGAALHPDIDLFYTGAEITSSAITVADVTAFTAAAGRAPLIWDNYPANDLTMRPEMHIGPLRGRDPALHSVCRGFAANLMSQAEASRIALLTIADYLRDPYRYDPEVSWERALREVGGAENYEPLRRFAENSLGSVLCPEEAPEMTRLASAALASLRRGEAVMRSRDVALLSEYFDVLDESTYHLKNRMANLALRHDLLPWIEALDEKFWLGRGALRTLRAIEEGADYQSALRFTEGLLDDTRRNVHHIAGTALLDLAEYARQCAAQVDAVGTGASYQSPPAAAERDRGQDDGAIIAFPDLASAGSDLDVAAGSG